MGRNRYFFLGFEGAAEARTNRFKSFLIDAANVLVGTLSSGVFCFFSIGVLHDAS
jgi:hypothetical protein